MKSNNCEWQATYSDSKSLLRKVDRRGGDFRDETGNQTQTIKEITEYEQVNWEESAMPPMMRHSVKNNKGRESESLAAKKQLSNKSNELEISKLNSCKSMMVMQKEKHIDQ